MKKKIFCLMLSLIMVFGLTVNSFAYSNLEDEQFLDNKVVSSENEENLEAEKEGILNSIKKQLEAKGDESQYEVYEKRGVGRYHPAGGGTSYELDYSVRTYVNRTFIPNYKVDDFVYDIERSERNNWLVGLLGSAASIWIGPLGVMKSSYIIGQVSSHKWDIKDVHNSGYGNKSVQILFAVDRFGDGTPVVFEWDRDYLLYDSSAENLKFVEW